MRKFLLAAIDAQVNGRNPEDIPGNGSILSGLSDKDEEMLFEMLEELRKQIK